MGPNSRKLLAATCIGVLIVLAAVFTVSLGHAETSILKPNVPTFTAKLVDHSYEVPTTASIDPYTGQTVNHPAHHVENSTIDLTIKNQPYTPILVHEGTSNWTASFYYNVRVKGHYADDWMNVYSPDTDYPKKSNSTYTVLTYSTRGDNGFDVGGRMLASNSGNQIDFQVQAMIGATHRGYSANATDQLDMFPFVFDGETSVWSSTQTVIILDNSATATSNSSTSPTQVFPTINTGPIIKTYWGLNYGEILIIAILAIISVLLAILIAVFYGRKVK